ncbi:aminotransferase-like domain-containing protein [Maledivibacter halophilus]|uniref:HTH-type transcriptional regulator NorG n=1 Tax=Maledivibacter halophilus TaxID=36842 RepID=A0A1T5MVN4_9FIRM|nr:PLP-dependent aminotransferase family protein [Maledivibacter halophilus]SKC92257.1 GntR family transcriptional regulator, regulator for abcA and norABC [Maledivibacter halophilus]
MIINWKPNKTLNIPLYKQIVNYIKNKISTGQWDIGSKLPTQRELAKVFDVNRSTVVEALDELKAEGLIEANGRGGTIIVNNTWSLLASTPPPNWHEYVKSGLYKPNQPTIQAINRLEFKKEIIRLGTGELSPELYPKEMMKRILNNVSNKIENLGYEEPKGALFLRQAISKYLEKFNINASPSSILIVSGSLQALHLISIGILHPYSTVLLESPSYLKSLYIFESVGMRLKRVSMDEYGIKADEIIENRSKNNTTLLYTIPTFQNPTGIVMSQERRNEIIKACGKYRIPIIEDDAYRELSLEDEPPMPLKAIDRNGIVLYMGSISKTLAAGLRIGWLVGPQPVIERLGDIKMQIDYGASSLSQWVVAELLNSDLYEKYLIELRRNLKIRRQIVLDILQKYFIDIATWNKPIGGFYIWLHLRKQISMKKLFELSAKEGLLINPGNIYDFSNHHCIRISYSYASLEDLEKGLKRLAKLIIECNKKSY